MVNQFAEDMQQAFIKERKKRANFFAQQLATQQFGPDPTAKGPGAGQGGGAGTPSQPPATMQSNGPGAGIAQRMTQNPYQSPGGQDSMFNNGGIY